MSEISEQEAKEFAGMYEDGYVIRELQQENQHLKQRELELMAQVGRVKGALMAKYFGTLDHQEIVRINNETPQQSLAKIQVEAVKTYMQFLYDEHGVEPEDLEEVAQAYINQLRQQADKGKS